MRGGSLRKPPGKGRATTRQQRPLARFGQAWLRVALPGRATRGRAWLGLAWGGLASLGLAWRVPASLGLAWPG
eukprot:12289014-Alexandrium_andersonii.AAC.1